MKDRKGVVYFVLAAFFLFFALPAAAGHPISQKKKKGDISVTFGPVSNTENLPGSIGIIKTIAWRPLTQWISIGGCVGIVQNEVPIMANLPLNIPLKWVEPFATAGLGIDFQNLSSAKNYGGGIKIRVTQRAAAIVEYRNVKINNTSRLHSKHSLNLEYIGAGITYYF